MQSVTHGHARAEGGIASVDVLESAYKKEMLTATATAIVSAYSDPNTCTVTGLSCAETGEKYSCCEIKVDNYPEDLSKDGIAEAGTSLAPFAKHIYSGLFDETSSTCLFTDTLMCLGSFLEVKRNGVILQMRLARAFQSQPRGCWAGNPESNAFLIQQSLRCSLLALETRTFRKLDDKSRLQSLLPGPSLAAREKKWRPSLKSL
jgi:hypothetical protein